MRKRRRQPSAIAHLDLPVAQQQRLTELAKHASSTEAATALLIGHQAARAAEAVASALGRPLIRIDLSRVVSRYLGETEKNLRITFDEAEAAGAVLFFDEADALFGDRSETRDGDERYPNQEVEYLLTRIQEHEGVTMLASNMKGSQETFRARFDYVIELDTNASTD